MSGMIQLTIRSHCERVGIQNAHQLKLKLGCHIQTATQLWHETLTRIDFEILSKLLELFKCPIDQVLVKQNGKPKRKA